MGNCAGIDWAAEKHDMLIEDPAGEELLAATFAHDEDGVSALCAAPPCFEVEVVAIERPDGVLVERLLESGVRVLALHPNQVKAARDRFRASGGKSDQFDRFVLCELARTDRRRFRILEPDSDETKAIRDQSADARTGGSRRGAGRVGQPAARRAGAVLAGSDPVVLRDRQPVLARVSRPLPQPGRCPWAGREAPGRVPEGPPLHQPQDRSAAAGAPAVRCGRSRRRDRNPADAVRSCCT
jgi:Transposase